MIELVRNYLKKHNENNLVPIIFDSYKFIPKGFQSWNDFIDRFDITSIEGEKVRVNYKNTVTDYKKSFLYDMAFIELKALNERQKEEIDSYRQFGIKNCL